MHGAHNAETSAPNLSRTSNSLRVENDFTFVADLSPLCATRRKIFAAYDLHRIGQPRRETHRGFPSGFDGVSVRHCHRVANLFRRSGARVGAPTGAFPPRERNLPDEGRLAFSARESKDL